MWDNEEADWFDTFVGLLRTALAGVGVVATVLVVGFWLGYV